MFCQCSSSDKSYVAMHEKDANGNPDPFTFDYQFYVHTVCMKPSRQVFEKETSMHAPRRATFLLSSNGREDGTFVQRWATDVRGERIETMTFNPYGKGPNMTVDHGRNHLLEFWKKLDETIDSIRAQATPDEAQKVRASTLAEVISMLMRDFYDDSQAVLRESMLRWKARQAGEDRDTPGLAEVYWRPVDVTASRSGGAVSKTASPKNAKVVPQLDDVKINFIKHCLATGAQSAKALAKMLETTEDVIEQYRE